MNLVNKKNRYIKFLFLIIFIIFQTLVMFGSVYTFYVSFLCILIFFLNVYPLYKFILSYKTNEEIPLFEFTHIYFLIAYTLGILFIEYSFYFFEKNISHKLLTNTLEVYLIGLLFFNLGNYLVRKNLKKKINESSNYLIDNNKELLIFGFFSYLLLIVFFYFFKDLQIIKKVYQIKFSIIYLSILTIYLYILKNQNLGLIAKLALAVLITFLIFVELLSGSITFPIMLTLSIYLFNFVYTKKINIKFFITIFLLFTILHSFKYEYREETWTDKDSVILTWKERDKQMLNSKNKNLFKKNFDKTIKYVHVIYSNTFSSSNQTAEYYKNIFFERNIRRLIHSFSSLAIVTNFSPEKIPYWNGHSYKIMLSKFIPRVFWKNKPSDTLGNAFGRRYTIFWEGDRLTSWNMPVLNEFYANFGRIGVAVGMFILGVLFKTITQYFLTSKNNYMFLIVFITIYPLFYLESHLSMIFGSKIQSFIFLLIYVYILKIITKRLKFIFT